MTCKKSLQEDCGTQRGDLICYVESVTVRPGSIFLTAGSRYSHATAQVHPSDADCKAVIWHSDNTSVVTVDPYTGYIRTKIPGIAKVYATACDGSGCSDFLYVSVLSTTGEDIEPEHFKEHIHNLL